MTHLHPMTLRRRFHGPKFYDTLTFGSFQMTLAFDRYVRYDRGRMNDPQFVEFKNPEPGTFENFPHFHQNIFSNCLKYLQMKVFHLHLYQDTKNSFMVRFWYVFGSTPLIGCGP